MSDLDKLIEAVEAGRGDAVSIFTKRLSSAARDRGAYWPSHDVEKAFSGSLDAALALHMHQHGLLRRLAMAELP